MECSVCYGDVSAPVKLVCGHVFCKDCIKSWYLKGSGAGCPMCRRPVYFKGFHKVRQEWENESWYNQCQDLYGKTFEDQLETMISIAKMFNRKKMSAKCFLELESTFECILSEGLEVDDMDYVLNESEIYMSSRLFNRVKFYDEPIKAKVMRRDNKQRRKWTL